MTPAEKARLLVLHFIDQAHIMLDHATLAAEPLQDWDGVKHKIIETAKLNEALWHITHDHTHPTGQ